MDIKFTHVCSNCSREFTYTPDEAYDDYPFESMSINCPYCGSKEDGSDDDLSKDVTLENNRSLIIVLTFSVLLLLILLLW